MIMLCTLFIYFLGSFTLVFSLPHPIQDADNTTRCEFASIPTGYLTVGKTLSVPGECMIVTCQEDLTISGLTCPTYFNVRGCYLSEMNKYKEYPECCPQMICKFNRFEKYLIRIRRSQQKLYKTKSST